MLGLQDKLRGHAARPSFKSVTSQLPSLQILKSCCNRVTVLQVMAHGECSTSFLVQVQQTCWVGHRAWWSYSPWSKQSIWSCPSMSICSAVSTYTSSAREGAGQHAASSGEEQPPYHNLDGKEGNLFSTQCAAGFPGEAFWVVSIITAQSPSSKAHYQRWLNSVFSESRLEVLTFIRFQMWNWQSNSQSRIGRRPQATQNRFWCQFPSTDKY